MTARLVPFGQGGGKGPVGALVQQKPHFLYLFLWWSAPAAKVTSAADGKPWGSWFILSE